jgi:predicted deacetylase
MTHEGPKRLLVSIHDVGPAFRGAVEHLAERLTKALGGPRFAMLVVPNHWGAHPLSADRVFCAQLRAWADAGVEMFLHGWFHKDECGHTGVRRLMARHLTAGEGEFLGLTSFEAARRMLEGKSLLEDLTGRAVAGFVAPAWLYGENTRVALTQCGFALAEDHLRIWRPDNGVTLAHAPAITWASRSPVRTLSSIAFAAIARTALRPLPTVRIAVHPGDVTKSKLLTSIDRTVAAFSRDRRISRYADLLR